MNAPVEPGMVVAESNEYLMTMPSAIAMADDDRESDALDKTPAPLTFRGGLGERPFERKRPLVEI